MQVDHGVGKTKFVLDMATSTIENNNKVLMFSIEESKESIKERLGKAEEYLDNKLFVDTTSKPSMNYIEEQCRKIKQTYDISLVVIDYIQLVETDNKIYLKLKELAKELNVTVLVVYMMSGGNTTNEKPSLEDIKDKSLVEIADKVVILHRVIDDNKTTDKGLEVIIAKSSYDTKE